MGAWRVNGDGKEIFSGLCLLRKTLQSLKNLKKKYQGATKPQSLASHHSSTPPIKKLSFDLRFQYFFFHSSTCTRKLFRSFFPFKKVASSQKQFKMLEIDFYIENGFRCFAYTHEMFFLFSQFLRYFLKVFLGFWVFNGLNYWLVKLVFKRYFDPHFFRRCFRCWWMDTWLSTAGHFLEFNFFL